MPNLLIAINNDLAYFEQDWSDQYTEVDLNLFPPIDI